MHSSEPLVVAARHSRLSRAQVEEVFRELAEQGVTCTYQPHWVTTTGDQDLSTSLRNLEKSDFFTKEIDELLLAGGARVAVHSAKDLPEPLPAGLCVAALTRGVDPSDVLVLREGQSLDDLPEGAAIGTSSDRREQAIQALRSDLRAVDIRGTIDRRLSLLDEGVVDGLVVAHAALIRLGYQRTVIPLGGEVATLQGRLAVVVRVGDEAMMELFRPIDARPSLLYLGTEAPACRTAVRVVHAPIIHLEPVATEDSALATALRDLHRYTHFFFTSKQAAGIFTDRLQEQGQEIPRSAHVVAIGEATAERLRQRGWVVNEVVESSCQEGFFPVVERLQASDLVCYPHSSLARSCLVEKLAMHQAHVHHFALYHTQPRLQNIDPADFDEIEFTSPSTVHAFFAQFGSLPAGVNVHCQGPITEHAFKEVFHVATHSP